jgi:hypothetical protein
MLQKNEAIVSKKKSAKLQDTKLLSVEKENLITRHPLWSLWILSFLLLLIFYYPLMMAGKTLMAPDAMSSGALTPFVQDAQQRGMTPLWVPYIFSGMPSFGSLMSAPGINPVDDLFRSASRAVQAPAFTFILLNYLLFAGLVYVLMRDGKVLPLPAIFCGVAAMFMPQFVAFTAFGHNTKFLALVLIPIIIWVVRRLLEEKNLLYFSLTALAIGFQMVRAHIQVTYYTFLALIIYFLFHEIAEYREKKAIKPALISGLLLLGAVIAGVLLSAKLYVSVLDYQRFSIRGGGPGIEGGGGLDYGYASNWSFHPLEMVTFFIPSFMGFGGDTYWGKMPFTDYPLYFSIIILMLSGVALLLRRKRMTWFMGLLVLFALVVSFGNHVPVLYGPMFKILPFFNRFRVPSMIHILLNIGIVALAGYGLQGIIDLRSTVQKHTEKKQTLFRYLYGFAGLIGLAFLFLLFSKTLYLDMAGSGQAPLNEAQRVLAYNKTVLDALKAVILVLLSIVLITQFLKGTLSSLFLSSLLLGLVVVDLWMVDKKILNPRDAVESRDYFSNSAVVDFVKRDPGQFRVFPVLDDKTGNWYTYHFIQNISGYSPAKLRIYQEFLEETGFNSQDRYGLNGFISKYWRIVTRNGQLAPQSVPMEQIGSDRLNFESAMLDMLNVKYLILNHLPLQDPRYKMVYTQQPWVYENTTALPRAFFVDSTVTLHGRKEIFDYMKSGRFDPHRTAILEENAAIPIKAGAGNSATLTSFDIHEIHVDAKVNQAGLMVLSEIYYPAGWKVFVDSRESKIFKTNYILRSVFLQPGEHKIVFKFQPTSYRLGVWISLSTMILLVALLGYQLYVNRHLFIRVKRVEKVSPS